MGKDDSGPILVAVDGSTPSEAALWWAYRHSVSSGRTLRVMLVHGHPENLYGIPHEPVWPWPVVMTADTADLAKSAKNLEELVSTTLGEDAKFEVVVRFGDAANAILEEVVDCDASMLVMGRRGLGGFKSLLLGSVSDQCAGHSKCPVVITPADASDYTGPIVVGIDGSEGSNEAVEWAADLAASTNQSLLLTTCWDLSPQAYAYESLTKELENAVAQDVDSAKQLVAAKAASVAVETAILRGNTARELTELAKARKASLLVVGSRGYGGFRSLVLGSVARQTLHHSSTPVVVV